MKYALKQNKKRRVPKRLLIVLLVLAVILVASTGFAAKKKLLFFSDENSGENPQTEGLESTTGFIDYSPGKESDNQNINQQKESGAITDTPTEINESLQATIVGADYIKSTSTLEVRVLVSGAQEGECDLQLSKSGTTKSYEAAIIRQNTYFTCEGFDISTIDLEDGEWNLSVTITSGEKSGNATNSKVTIN